MRWDSAGAVLLCALALAAGAGAAPTRAQVLLMPLARAAYGSLPTALTLDSSSGWTDNKHAAENDLDPHMTAARLASIGRITGYDVEFDDLGSASKPGVVVDADSEVDLFRSSSAAARYLALELSEFRRFAGKRLQYGATLDHVRYFAVPGVAGARGVQGRVHVGGLTFWETEVGIRAGKLAANVGLGRTDSRNVDAEVSRLAQKLKQRIDGVLAGRVHDRPIGTSGPKLGGPRQPADRPRPHGDGNRSRRSRGREGDAGGLQAQCRRRGRVRPRVRRGDLRDDAADAARS